MLSPNRQQLSQRLQVGCQYPAQGANSDVAFVCSGLRMREASLDWNRPVLGVANFNHYGAFRAVTHLKSASPRFRVPIFVTIFVEQMP
jgi:hypothetical protein